MKYEEPIIKIYPVMDDNVVSTSGEGFIPGQSGDGGAKPASF